MKITSWHCPRYAQTIRAQSRRPLSSSSSGRPPLRKREDHQLKDIVPGDLTATLEAHRRSNRIPFRRVAQDENTEQGEPDDQDVSVVTPIETEDSTNLPGPSQLLALVKKSLAAVDAIVGDESKEGAQGPVRRIKRVKVSSAKEETLNLKTRVLRLAPEAHNEDDLSSTMSAVKRSLNKSKQVSMEGRKDGYSNDNRQGDDEKYKKGHYVKAPITYDLREPPKPWAVSEPSLVQDRDRLLSAQMVKLSDWLTLTPAERDFRTDLALDLSHGLRKQLPETGFWLFGSHDTGLATVLSDVDIGFHMPSIQKAPGQRGPSTGLGSRRNRAVVSTALDSIFISSIWTKRFQDPLIVWARFPLVRMTHIGSQAEIQLVVSQPTRVVNEYIRDCLAEHRQLRPVFFLLKTALSARKLDEPKDGGIGSYTLLNLIIIALKAQQVHRRDSIANALHKVLRFISELDTRQIGLTTEYPYTFPKRAAKEIVSAKTKRDVDTDSVAWARHQIDVKDAKQDFLLCLQDPNDPLNDLGKSGYQILNVQVTIAKFKNALEAWLVDKEISLLQRTGRPPGPEQMMSWLIGKTCNVVQDRRDSFEHWKSSGAGQIELQQMATRLKDAQIAVEAYQDDALKKGNAESRTLDEAVDDLTKEVMDGEQQR